MGLCGDKGHNAGKFQVPPSDDARTSVLNSSRASGLSHTYSYLLLHTLTYSYTPSPNNGFGTLLTHLSHPSHPSHPKPSVPDRGTARGVPPRNFCGNAFRQVLLSCTCRVRYPLPSTVHFTTAEKKVGERLQLNLYLTILCSIVQYSATTTFPDHGLLDCN